MTTGLYHLVYYSQNKIARDPATFERHVADILEASRRNNTAVQITGALLFNEGCFAQVLEGPLPAIEATFERIQQDDRHGEVSLLALEEIEARAFPNWAMGFIGASQANASRFAQIGTASGFDPQQLGGKKIHAILRDLAMEEERPAA
jgi:hypothetical protein